MIYDLSLVYFFVCINEIHIEKHFSTIQTICPTVPTILVMDPIHFSFLQLTPMLRSI